MSDRVLPDALEGAGSLVVAFQPIFEVRGGAARLHSLEALVRGSQGSGLGSAQELFDRARREGVESVVDRACLKAIFEAIARAEYRADLSVNVHAATLCGDPEFPGFFREMAQAHALDLCRVTLEIVEPGPSRNDAWFREALSSLRQGGVSLALDDVGLGCSSYGMMLDCAPDYVKVDRYLVTGCDEDLRRRAVLDSIFLLGARLGARMIAEGVETAGELRTLTSLGVELFQGFFLSRPVLADDLRRTLVPLPEANGFIRSALAALGRPPVA